MPERGRAHQDTAALPADPDAAIPYTKREEYAVLRPVQKAFLAAQRIWGYSGRIPTISQVRIEMDLVEMKVRGVKVLPGGAEAERHDARHGRDRLVAAVRARPEEIPAERPEETVDTSGPPGA